MADFVTLSCPLCGGKLQITNDIERFACAYGGSEHVVKRSGGVVSLSPVIQELKKVQVGVDKTASELAIRRLRDEITALRQTRIDTTPRLSVGTLVFACIFGIIGAVVAGPGGLFLGYIVALIIVIIHIRVQQAVNSSKIRSIEWKIAEKQAELEKHRQIASK